MAGTSVLMTVTDASGAAVSQAVVNFIVNGIGLKPVETDSFGRVALGWAGDAAHDIPAEGDVYRCNYTVRKKRLIGGTGSPGGKTALLKKLHHIRVVLTPDAPRAQKAGPEPTLIADLRRYAALDDPSAHISEGDVVDLLLKHGGRAGDAFDGVVTTAELLHYIAPSDARLAAKATAEVLAKLRAKQTLETIRRTSAGVQDGAVGIWKDADNVGKASIISSGITVVLGCMEVVQAFESGDPVKAAKSTVNLMAHLALDLNPFTGALDLVLSLACGPNWPAEMFAPKISARVVDAVVRQKLLPEFNRLTGGPNVRIVKSRRMGAWTTVAFKGSRIVPGLGFDEGVLAFFDESGWSMKLRVPESTNLIDLRRVLERASATTHASIPSNVWDQL